MNLSPDDEIGADVLAAALERYRDWPYGDRLVAVSHEYRLVMAERFPSRALERLIGSPVMSRDEIGERRRVQAAEPVLREEARAAGLEVADLIGRGVKPGTLAARAAVAWRLSRELKLAQRAIAQLLGIGRTQLQRGIRAHEEAMAAAAAAERKEAVGGQR